MELLVLGPIWIIIGLLVGLLAGSIWERPRPLGELGDYALAIVLAILTGLVDWYLLPILFDLSGPLRFVAAVVEPLIVAFLALWALRALRKA